MGTTSIPISDGPHMLHCTVLNIVTGYLGQDQLQHEQRQQAGGGQQVGPQQVQDEAATTSGVATSEN